MHHQRSGPCLFHVVEKDEGDHQRPRLLPHFLPRIPRISLVEVPVLATVHGTRAGSAKESVPRHGMTATPKPRPLSSHDQCLFEFFFLAQNGDNAERLKYDREKHSDLRAEPRHTSMQLTPISPPRSPPPASERGEVSAQPRPSVQPFHGHASRNEPPVPMHGHPAKAGAVPTSLPCRSSSCR